MPIEWPFPFPNMRNIALFEGMSYEERMEDIKRRTLYWYNAL